VVVVVVEKVKNMEKIGNLTEALREAELLAEALGGEVESLKVEVEEARGEVAELSEVSGRWRQRGEDRLD
jgi:hypothetical protein